MYVQKKKYTKAFALIHKLYYLFLQEMAPKYKLTYFNLRGLAEPVRFMLSYMEEDFEDVRIERDNNWAALKPCKYSIKSV